MHLHKIERHIYNVISTLRRFGRDFKIWEISDFLWCDLILNCKIEIQSFLERKRFQI